MYILRNGAHSDITTDSNLIELVAKILGRRLSNDMEFAQKRFDTFESAKKEMRREYSEAIEYLMEINREIIETSFTDNRAYIKYINYDSVEDSILGQLFKVNYKSDDVFEWVIVEEET